ncbi:MAG TPA: polysaccharide deacetylase family protein [Thermoanaerobaculia bacterium]|nr:polysaccharide deacetylase family protein [Thermoanaerobaculia bacterium]
MPRTTERASPRCAVPPPPRAYRRTALIRATWASHLSAIAALGIVPERWPWILGALAANHLVIGGTGLIPTSRLLGPNLTRLTGGPANAVALTFDDGPDSEVTPRVLDLLDERGARASFFVIGKRVEAHPDLAAEIVRRGHAVENHTYRHRHDFSLRGPRALDREVTAAQESIATATGRYPTWFRAPAGLRGVLLEPVLARHGLSLAAWTRRAYDTVVRDPAQIVARLGRNLSAGDVLLLHDGSAARTAAGRPALFEALPRLLDLIAERGLVAVPLPETEVVSLGPQRLAAAEGARRSEEANETTSAGVSAPETTE